MRVKLSFFKDLARLPGITPAHAGKTLTDNGQRYMG